MFIKRYRLEVDFSSLSRFALLRFFMNFKTLLKARHKTVRSGRNLLSESRKLGNTMDRDLNHLNYQQYFRV